MRVSPWPRRAGRGCGGAGRAGCAGRVGPVPQEAAAREAVGEAGEARVLVGGGRSSCYFLDSLAWSLVCRHLANQCRFSGISNAV